MSPVYRYDIEQNTDEWERIKTGMFSASMAEKLLSGKDTKGYKNLIAKIAEERITGKRCENDEFKGNWATNRGHELEPIARHDYEYRTLNAVNVVGVVIKDEWALCSPDGLIGHDTLHQIKCPIFSTQKEYLEKASRNTDPKKIIPPNYYKQMTYEMYVSDRKYNIFTAYHPSLKPLDIVIERDEDMIKFIELRLSEAIEDVKSNMDRINNL